MPVDDDKHSPERVIRITRRPEGSPITQHVILTPPPPPEVRVVTTQDLQDARLKKAERD
jgi:hypothetical protein